MLIADLHIHSRYSRATSREADAPHLDLWARNKGIQLVGTGDFTHPAWRNELQDVLTLDRDGLYTLKEEHRLPASVHASFTPRFVVSGEISTIYKKNGKTRKLHHVILLPNLEAAEELSHKLEAIGNLRSDGRPILGLDSRNLLEIILETCPRAVYIPAHIWTPHFSLFGAFSGFDTLEECYEDLSVYVHALETGLSADPAMIRRISTLDQYTLVSNSDAHSPAKLGREANVVNISPSYDGLARAIQTGEGFTGTLEFYPEEGKYHLDGHRNCHVCLDPDETISLNGKCPVCGRGITIGVLHRVCELADRPVAVFPSDGKAFESLIPLPELIAACTGFSAVGQKTQLYYQNLLSRLGPELYILREATISDLEKAAGHAIAEGIRRMRTGQVVRKSGYDGEYGRISLFEPAELEQFNGQVSMFGLAYINVKKPANKAFPQSLGKAGQVTQKQSGMEAFSSRSLYDGLNSEQLLAVTMEDQNIAIIAGPGTGKTKTLVARIVYLLERLGVSPGEITAVTFSRQAALEVRERLESALGKKRARALTIGTFHGICLHILPPKPLLNQAQCMEIIREILLKHGSEEKPLPTLRKISMVKNGESLVEADLNEDLYAAYIRKVNAIGARDLDDLLLDALKQEAHEHKPFSYLLVDEYQDINSVQRRLITHWHGQINHLFTIGDPDQSIYGFRGASSDCFIKLADDIPGLRFLSLRENYRSTPAILHSALSVISRNSGEQRLLHANQPSALPVRLMEAGSKKEEYIWIANEIARMIGGLDMLCSETHARRSFADVAILCRTRRQLEQMETCLAHDDIPCVVHGHENYLSDNKVMGTLGFFHSLLHPEDSAALTDCLQYIWNIPAPLIQRTAFTMAESAHEHGLDINRLRTELSEFSPLADWLSAVEAFEPRVRAAKPRQLLQQWVKVNGKSAAIEQLLRTSLFHETMESLWRAVTLGEEGDIRRVSGKAYSSEAVRLMTLHGSKGLEFPVVFLVCDDIHTEGKHWLPAEMEEERRLFYVGMTRAREELILTIADEPLCFLSELGDAIERGVIKQRKRDMKAKQLTFLES